MLNMVNERRFMKMGEPANAFTLKHIRDVAGAHVSYVKLFKYIYVNKDDTFIGKTK